MSTVSIPSGITMLSGPLITGFIVNWGFYGMLVVQTCLYYILFPKDASLVKLFVCFLFLVETTQSLFVIRDAFAVYGSGYGDVSLLVNIPFIWLSVPIMSGIVSCSVQCFFAYRIIVFSGRRILGILICALAIAEGIAAVVVGIQLKEIVSFPQLQSAAFISKAVWMAGSALCDVVIAVLMTYFLSRNNQGLRSTQLYVNGLIRLFIQSGSITALAAIADLTIFLAFPHNDYHIVPCLIMSKFYSNTTLAILNSRAFIRVGLNLTSADVVVSGSPVFGTSRITEGIRDGGGALSMNTQMRSGDGRFLVSQPSVAGHGGDENAWRSLTPISSGETHKGGNDSGESLHDSEKVLNIGRGL